MQTYARRFLSGTFFQGLQALALLFVLFGPDVVAMKSAPDSIDPIIDALLIASMVLFTLDLALCLLCRPRLSMLEARCTPRMPGSRSLAQHAATCSTQAAPLHVPVSLRPMHAHRCCAAWSAGGARAAGGMLRNQTRHRHG